MSLICPNKNSLEWKRLVSTLGENKAYAIFIANNERVPDMDTVNDILNEMGIDALNIQYDKQGEGDIQYNNKGEVLAPNDKISKLYKDIEALEGVTSKEQALQLYKQTRSKEFKDWFGDSKVVDENGEPLLVYHGSDFKFDKFSKQELGKTTEAPSANEGFFFTDVVENAKYYQMYNNMDFDDTLASEQWEKDTLLEINNKTTKIEKLKEEIAEAEQTLASELEEMGTSVTYELYAKLESYEKDKEKLEKAYNDTITRKKSEATLYAVFLNIDNTLIEDDKGSKKREDSYTNRLIKAKELGKNGLIIENTFDPLETNIYVAFEPNQIKSVFNKGEFSKENNNIYYQNHTNQSDKDYIASEKTIRDLAARIADRIGLKVEFENIQTFQQGGQWVVKDVENNKTLFTGTKEESKKWVKDNKYYKGKLEGDTAIINLAYATLDTPIHEILGHPIIRALKNSDPGDYLFETEGGSQLYQNLLKELEYGKGKEVLDRIKRDYVEKPKLNITNRNQYVYKDITINGIETSTFNNVSFNFKNKEYNLTRNGIVMEIAPEGGVIVENMPDDLKNKAQEVFNITQDLSKNGVPQGNYTLEEQQEEPIVELLGLYTAGKITEKNTSKNLIGYLKQLWKEMKAFMKKLLLQHEVEIDKLPDNMTIGDIADLLAYSNSKLILPGNEVIYTTPDNQKFKTYQEASNHISELTKLDEVDLSKIIFSNEQQKLYWIVDGETGEIQESGLTKEEAETKLLTYNKNLDEYTPPYFIDIALDTKGCIANFVLKNKEYEQSKEIIEEWKKVNSIKYDPEEVYSRGRRFYHKVGAFVTSFDPVLMMQNYLAYLQDYERVGAELVINGFTRTEDSRASFETEDKDNSSDLRIVIYPESDDIKWVARKDAMSGTTRQNGKNVSEIFGIERNEIAGVGETKAPTLDNLKLIESSLAEAIRAEEKWKNEYEGTYNEIGLRLTGTNFRFEYDSKTPYQQKKMADRLNAVLDEKYGKIKESKIYDNPKQPSQTKKNLKDSIENVANKYQSLRITVDETGNIDYITDFHNINKAEANNILNKISNKQSFKILNNNFYYGKVFIGEDSETGEPFYEEDWLKEIDSGESSASKDIEYINKGLNKVISNKEYTSQAEINTKVVALKGGKRQFQRSLIRSEVRKDVVSKLNQQDMDLGFDPEELPFQKLPSTPKKSIKVESDDKLELSQESKIALDELNNRIVNLRRYRDKNPHNEASINAKLKEIYDIKKDINERDVLATITNFAKNRLIWCNSLINKNDINSGELTQVTNETNMWRNIMNQWLTLTAEGEEKTALQKAVLLRREVDDINKMITKLDNEILRLNNEFFMQVANEKRFDKTTIGDLFKQEDTPLQVVGTMNLDRSHNPVLKVISNILSDTSKNMRVELLETINKPMMSYVKKSKGKWWDLSKQSGLLNFIQKNEKGEPVGELLSYESPEYRKLTEELRLEKIKLLALNRYNGAEQVKAIKGYRRKLLNAQVLFNPKTLFKNNELSDVYKEKIRKQVGDELYEESIKESEELWNKWLSDKDLQTESIKNDVTTDESIPKDKKTEVITDRLTEWIQLNSPEIYISQLYSNDVEWKKNYGYKYIKTLPRIYNTDGTTTEFYNKDYDNIKNDNEAFEFFKWYKETLNTLFKFLPKEITRGIGTNYLPELMKDLGDHYREERFKGVRGNIMKAMYDSITDTVIDPDLLNETDEKGRIVKSIPIRYMNNRINELNKKINNLELSNEIKQSIIDRMESRMDDLRKKNNIAKIDKYNQTIKGYQDTIEKHKKAIQALKDNRDRLTRNRSLDLVKIMSVFGEMSINYKYKSDIEDIVMIGKRVVDNQKEIVTNKLSLPQMFKGNQVLLEGELNRTKQMLEYAIDASLYGRKKEEGKLVKKRLIDNKEKRKEYNKLKKQKEELMNKYLKKEITDDEYEREEAIIENAIEELRLNRYLSPNKVVEKVINYTYLKGIGFNPFSASVNIMFGLISNSIHANSRVDFNTFQFRKAVTLMLKSSTKGSVTKVGDEKIMNIMEKLDILPEVNETNYGDRGIYKGKLNKLGIFKRYELQKRSEYFIHSTSTIASLMNIKKVGNQYMTFTEYKNMRKEELKKEEKEYNLAEIENEFDKLTNTLWDNIDKNGNITDSDMLEKDWNNIIGNDNSFLRKTANHIMGVNRKLHGDYDPDTSIMAKKWLLGRIAFIFRTWLPEALYDRFGKEDYDARLERRTKGRWLTYGSVGFENSIKTLYRMALNKKDKYEFMDNDLDIENMRKNLKELMWFSILLSVRGLLMLTLGDDDDDKGYERVVKTAINQLGRVQSDITFYVSPQSFDKIIRDPLPITKTLKEFGKAASGIARAANPLEDDDRYDTEYALKRIAKLFPYSGNMVTLFDTSEKLY
jgi:hypothetical protein